MFAVLSISPEVYDLVGEVFVYDKHIFIDRTSLEVLERRSTRTATLDGGAVLYDTGYSASDRTVKFLLRPEYTEMVLKLKTLVKTYSTVTLIIDSGSFQCHIQRVADLTKGLEVNLLILKEI